MKRIITLIVSAFLIHSATAQIWNLPARNPGAMNGTQFVAAITSLSFSARETMVEQEILAGNVPSFYRTLKPVTSTGTVSGSPQSVTYYVTPDYIAVGHDTDYFLCPMSPIIATHIGDATGTTLPTRKMVNDIYAAATVKLTPQPIPASGQMTTVPVFDDHNDSVRIQRNNATWGSHPLGELVGGDKKDVIIANSIYTTAGRVVIYGWHQSVGNPIQPSSNVHSDTYMDYSHGIRLIQSSVVYNGNPTTIQAILQSSTLNPLLSDEGTISTPNYPYSTIVTSLATPISFAIKNNGNNTLSILVANDNNASHYKVYTSTDGTTFGAPQTIIKTALTLSSLTPNQIYFVKIAAFNQTNNITSSTSELLAAVPCSWQDSILIVNGFDRASTGNTYDFVIEHGNAIKNAGYNFSSASNEAIATGLINLNTYKAVDWISGKESTANETFSTTEQTKVSDYLKQGGYFFTSGSEIGWDLDQAGSAGDKAFYNNYLKATYVMDAPNNQASIWYSCTEEASGIFNSGNTITFDNGSNGTYNVDYPDVLACANGSSPEMYYTSSASDIAGVSFSGMFPSGTANGKLVYLAFPFETVYPAAARNVMMGNVLDYFFVTPSVGLTSTPLSLPSSLYPNPASNFITLIGSFEEARIIDVQGKELIRTSDKTIDIVALQAGIYFVRVQFEGKFQTLKLVKE
ncbi:MAG: T9SS type A sorting domain-containing protein [Bacteroidota bacterium]|nr:T9SS type A sorting domain-containing protein [Bacteroidota bacterium]